MRIKETPTTISMYYQSLMQAYTEKKESKEKELQPIKEDIASLHSDVKLNMPFYYTTYDVQLYDYPEFMENRYIDGTFLSKAKQVYFNKHDGNKLVTEGLNLYTLALKQKDAAKIEKEIELYDKVLGLSKKEHREILQKFYQEVHKHLIMNGEGYVFEGCLGWICINRCHLINPRTTIDYTATRKKKEQLLDRLSEMLEKLAIPPAASPAKVRNYAMASKPMGVRLAWMCNYKGAMHSSPCGCAKPQLGGKWIILGKNGKETLVDDNK